MPVTPGLPLWFLGKNVTIQITPQDVSSSGAFSNDAIGTLTFNGRIEQDEHDLHLKTENISPTNAFQSNPVPVEVGFSYTVTEIMQAFPLVSSGNVGFGRGNVLEAAVAVSYYHRIVVTLSDDTAPTPNVIRAYTMYVLLTDVKRHSPKGKNTMTGTFQTILVADTGTGLFQANPALS